MDIDIGNATRAKNTVTTKTLTTVPRGTTTPTATLKTLKVNELKSLMQNMAIKNRSKIKTKQEMVKTVLKSITKQKSNRKAVLESMKPKLTSKQECMRGYRIKKHIASGTYGSVSQACALKNNCNYAVKVIKLRNAQERQAFEKEVNLSHILNQVNVGPKFYGAWHCKERREGVIVTELWDGTLSAHLNKIDANVIDTLVAQIDAMHKRGWMHLDVKSANILVKLSKDKKRILRVTLTDFGIAERINAKIRKSWLLKLYRYHMHDVFQPYNRQTAMNMGLTMKRVFETPTLLDKLYINSLYRRL
jgi:serine/threonine protein kinase